VSILNTIQEKILPKFGIPAVSEETVLNALRVVEDPDLHKDIVSLGFVKNVKVSSNHVAVTVELTTPACPVKELLKSQCEEAIKALPGVSTVEVTMTAQIRGPQVTAAVVAPSLGKVRNIIAVASGKGGVGKSTTAVNLAYALAKAGSKVGILDADIYGPSIPLMTKVGNPTESVGNMVSPPEVEGIKIISVSMFGSSNKATILRGPMAAQIIKQFLSQVAWGELDYLIIDYPPGTGDIQLTLSQAAPITGAVIVTTPQEVALIDVRKAINMFETLKVPVLGVVETMSYFVCDGCDKKHYIFRQGGGARVAGEHGLPMLGEIPMDANVTTGSDEGSPVVLNNPDSPAAKAYTAAAGQTAAQLSILNQADTGVLTQFSLEWH
jgi:ATP-binding protein involved in chromosome partitioning